MDLKNIFIVGAMGSGKSTIGRLFAQRCQKQFLDTDHEIENMQKEIDSLKAENEAMKEKMKQYDDWFAQLLNK